MPLAALPGKKPGTFLIEDYSTSIVPVPQLFAAEGKQEPAAKDEGRGKKPASLLLLGDVDFGPLAQAHAPLVAERGAWEGGLIRTLSEFAPLPATRAEILAVRDSFEERFPEGTARALRGAQATEAALREQAPRYQFLHLATHGFFAPPALRSALAPPPTEKPADAAMSHPTDLFGAKGIAGFHPGLLSGLVVAGANRPPEPGKDDGILTALEVADLDLADTHLVVLSACETGLGEEVAGGEGLLGLQRAFQVAGADSVVATLWKIPDQESSVLVAAFYQNLWKKQMPPREALRAAQLSMIKEGPKRGLEALDDNAQAGQPTSTSPYYWAAFVLSEEGL
jgi:CHAT domain-containing protein